MCTERNEKQYGSLYPVLRPGDARIAHAVPALIRVERGLARLPAGLPYRITIFNIEVAAARIHGHSIVAVARYAAELCIAIERIAAG